MANKWVLGARPRTLAAAIAPVLVATAFAGSDWKPFPAALALLVSLSLQIGVNTQMIIQMEFAALMIHVSVRSD